MNEEKNPKHICMLDCLTDKANLLAIKKQSRKVWRFRELSWYLLPAGCKANTMVWMTASVFTYRLWKIDDKCFMKERKIALILDMCTVYPRISS